MCKRLAGTWPPTRLTESPREPKSSGTSSSSFCNCVDPGVWGRSLGAFGCTQSWVSPALSHFLGGWRGPWHPSLQFLGGAWRSPDVCRHCPGAGLASSQRPQGHLCQQHWASGIVPAFGPRCPQPPARLPWSHVPVPGTPLEMDVAAGGPGGAPQYGDSSRGCAVLPPGWAADWRLQPPFHITVLVEVQRVGVESTSSRPAAAMCTPSRG